MWNKNFAVTLLSLTIISALIIFECSSPLQVSGLIAEPQANSVSKLWEQASKGIEVDSPTAGSGFIYSTTTSHPRSIDLILQCFDSFTGTEKWSYPQVFSYTVADGYVYIRTFFGLICLYAQTGSERWSFWGRSSYVTPVVSDGILYTTGFDPSQGYPVDTGFVYAVNASTGTKIWGFAGPFGSSLSGKSLVLNGTTLYVKSVVYSDQNASYHSSIYALNAYSGVELWNYAAPGQFNSVVANNQEVFVSSNFVNTTIYADAEASGGYVYKGGVCALNASDGALLWNYSTGNSVTNIDSVNDTLYAVSADGVLYAFDAKDGRIIWSYASETSLGSLLPVDGYLYVGSSLGVYCFNANDGKVVWNFAAPGFYGASSTLPVYADGVVYFGWNGPVTFASGPYHNFYALAASNGEILWSYMLNYTIRSFPVVIDRVVYIGASFVTDRNANFLGSGAVLALKSNVFDLPTPMPTLPISPAPTLASPSPTPTLPTPPSPSTTPTESPLPSPTSSPLPSEVPGQFRFSWVEVALAVAVLAVGGVAAYFLRRSQKQEAAKEP